MCVSEVKKSTKRINKKIILLAAGLVVALIPWGFILFRHLGHNDIIDPEPPGSEMITGSEPSEGSSEEPIEGEAETEDDGSPDVGESEEEPETTLEPPGTPEPSEEPPEQVPEYPQIVVENTANADPELNDELDRIARKFNCASVNLAVYNGETGEYYTYQYGYANIRERVPVDDDTLMRAASLSKLTTVICAMVLVDEGRLDLDEDISTYLKVDVVNPNFPNTPITTRMLMQHTSSINDSETFESSRWGGSSLSTFDLLEMRTSYGNREPGRVFQYSNLGYSMIAAVCEMITNKSFDTFAREVLFDPMGIDAAYVPSKLHDTGNIAVIYNESHGVGRSVEVQLGVTESNVRGSDHHLAQGNLTIRAVDYAKILAVLGNDGMFGDIKILSSEAVQEIHDTDVQGASYRQGLATRYSAVSFMPDGSGFWHTGSAYGTFAQNSYFINEKNYGVVIITTGASVTRLANGMINVCNELSETALRILNFE